MSSGLGGGPAGLIPGDPGSLEQTAGQLGAWGDSLELAAEGLRRIDTSAGWSGRAADQLRAVFDNQPGRWLRAADAFRQAAGALQRYAAVLRWAQGQAATAITTWSAGPAHHQAAQEILASARAQLASAARTAAQAIGQARDLAPPKPGLLAEIGDDLGGTLSSAWHGTLRLGEYGVDGLASMANAALHDPTATLSSVGGMLLAGASAGGEGLGVALDATGVGSVAGVPLNVLSAAGMATGATLVGTGLAKITADAAGPDRVSSDTTHSSLRGGEGDRGIESSEVIANAQNVYYDENGNQVYVWSQENGMNQVTIRNPANGNIVTNQWSTGKWIESQTEKRRWYSLGG